MAGTEGRMAYKQWNYLVLSACGFTVLRGLCLGHAQIFMGRGKSSHEYRSLSFVGCVALTHCSYRPRPSLGALRHFNRVFGENFHGCFTSCSLQHRTWLFCNPLPLSQMPLPASALDLFEFFNPVVDPLVNAPMITILTCWCSYLPRRMHRCDE